MADFKVYLLRQYACNQKTNGELWYSKTISKFLSGPDRFSKFVLDRRHVNFKLRVFHLWLMNFAAYEESTSSPVWGLFFSNRCMDLWTCHQCVCGSPLLLNNIWLHLLQYAALLPPSLPLCFIPSVSPSVPCLKFSRNRKAIKTSNLD